MSNKDYIVNELIAKHLAGETSAAEERELLSWVNASEGNKRHFEELKKAFHLADRHFADTSFEELPIDLDKEWDQFRGTVNESKIRPLSGSRVWFRVAATLLLLVATGAVLYFITRPGTVVHQTASGTETIVLPDGSTVALNRFTSLSFERGYGDKSRTVRLKGEAFFDVQQDAARPFIVLTDDATVQVVGTSFNVNAYDSLREVQVIVQTGIVSLQPEQGEQKVQLAAGQKGVYFKANGQLSSTVNHDVNFGSWNTRRIVFRESDLRTVIETLRKTYNAEIVVTTDIPASCIVTVTFDHQSLESVLKVLESTLNLKYTIKGNTVEITEAGC